MLLADLFEPDDEFDAIITIQMTPSLFGELSLPLLESVWQPSGQPGVMVRVDPARPEMNQLRHAHVALKKHTGSKSKQASWNDDGTRHDRKTFNAQLADRQSFQAAAREALGLGPDIVLEWISLSDPVAILAESICYEQPVSVVLAASRAIT